MNLLKLCCLLALGVAGVCVQATNSSSSSSFAGEDVQAPITKAELDALLSELKAAVAADPSLADIFNGVDFDELLKLTPDEVRAKLNALVFEATPKPTTAAKDAQTSSNTTTTTTTPTTAPTATPQSGAGSVFTATAAVGVASVVTYVVY